MGLNREPVHRDKSKSIIKPEANTITIDIWGCCVCRDIFSMVEGKQYIINKFNQVSFISQFDGLKPSPEHFLTYDDLIPRKKHFYQRIALVELNRTALDDFNESLSDWIIIDTRFFTYPYIIVTINGQEHYYSSYRVSEQEVRASINKMGLTIDSIRTGILDNEIHDKVLPPLCSFLKSRYGDKIILIDTSEALWKMDIEGFVSINEEKISQCSNASRTEHFYFDKLQKMLNCYYIKIPTVAISDDLHLWGGGRVHYVWEIYDYANKCVDCIFSNDSDYFRKCNSYYLECVSLLENMITNNSYSVRNITRRIQIKAKKAETKEQIDELLNNCKKAYLNAKTLEVKTEIAIEIGSIYRSRPDDARDLHSSANWYRIAAPHSKWANHVLYDLLWKINTPDSLLELTSRSYSMFQNGDGYSASIIGKLYC